MPMQTIVQLCFILIATHSFSQKSDSIDCISEYIRAEEASLEMERDSLLKSAVLFNLIIENLCTAEIKDHSRYHLGTVYKNLGRYRKAIRTLDEAKFQTKDSLFISYVYLEKALSYHEKGKFNKALDAINYSLKLYAANGELVFRKGEILFKNQKYSEVQSLFRSIENDFYQLNINILTCISAYKEGDFELSEILCKRILAEKNKYSKESINSVEIIQMLIKEQSGKNISQLEKEQLTNYSKEDIDTSITNDFSKLKKRYTN